MQAVKITRRLDSETLHLPELRPLLGKEVGIVVRATEAEAFEGPTERYPLRGSVVWDGDPFAPAVPEEDWDVYRRSSSTPTSGAGGLCGSGSFRSTAWWAASQVLREVARVRGDPS